MRHYNYHFFREDKPALRRFLKTRRGDYRFLRTFLWLTALAFAILLFISTLFQ